MTNGEVGDEMPSGMQLNPLTAHRTYIAHSCLRWASSLSGAEGRAESCLEVGLEHECSMPAFWGLSRPCGTGTPVTSHQHLQNSSIYGLHKIFNFLFSPQLFRCRTFISILFKDIFLVKKFPCS